MRALPSSVRDAPLVTVCWRVVGMRRVFARCLGLPLSGLRKLRCAAEGCALWPPSAAWAVTSFSAMLYLCRMVAAGHVESEALVCVERAD